MPVSPEKKKKFLKRVDRFLDLNQRVTDKEIKRSVKVLKDTRNRVIQDFQTLDPTEFQTFFLPQLKGQLESRLADLGADITSELNKSQERMFELAIDKADELVSAAGIDLSPTLVSPELLSATQTLSGELIVTVPQKLLSRLGNDIALGLMEQKSIGEVVADLRKSFDLETFQAERIARTEIMRTQSIAQHKRFENVVELQPGLLKTWRWSHKPDGRTGHAEAELTYSSEPIPFGDPFMVAALAGGKKEPMQFPRDPAGSASNVINCGCVHLLQRPDADRLTASVYIGPFNRVFKRAA